MDGVHHPFIPGLELSGLFYEEAVKPILEAHFPGVTYSAALLGEGSEVLGLDTAQSTDHDWGPRLMLFLAEADCESRRDDIDLMLCRELSPKILDYPVNLARADFEEPPAGDGPVDHSVTFFTIRSFFGHYLNYDPDEELGVVDWLTFPEQHLRSIASGRVYHDGLGQLELLQDRLRYYPRDVWLYLLATQWCRIGQEEAFMGRCGQVGDDLASRLVAARLVRDLMNLCFLMERQYAPYIKWFGTAFAQLDCAATLMPILTRVLEADSWQEREQHLTSAYEFVAVMHNDLGLTEPLPTQVSHFHNRPFLVIHGGSFVEALRAAITDEQVLALPTNLGGIDQFVDSTDVLSNPRRFDRLKLMYAQEEGPT